MGTGPKPDIVFILSVDEAGWTSYATFEAIAKAKGIQAPQIWEGKKGGGQTAVRGLNLEVRPGTSGLQERWLSLRAADLPSISSVSLVQAKAATQFHGPGWLSGDDDDAG